MASRTLCLLCLALVTLLNIYGTGGDCTANWRDATKVFTIRSNKFEISVSGASCRVFGVRPSGNVYRDEFAEFVVASEMMINQSTPLNANITRAERNISTQGVCSHRIENSVFQDPSNATRQVAVQRIFTNITLGTDTVEFDLAVSNDSYTVRLGSNITFTVPESNAKLSFVLGAFQFPSQQSWLLTKCLLKLYTNRFPSFNSTDSLLIPGRPETQQRTTEIVTPDIKVIYTVDRFAFADDQVYIVPSLDPLQLGQDGLAIANDPDEDRQYIRASFFNSWKYYRNITFWDPSLSIVFSTPESLPPSLTSSEPSIVRTLDAQRQGDFLAVAITVPIVLVVLIGVIVVVLVASPATRKRLFPFLAKRRDSLASKQSNEELEASSNQNEGQKWAQARPNTVGSAS